MPKPKTPRHHRPKKRASGAIPGSFFHGAASPGARVRDIHFAQGELDDIGKLLGEVGAELAAGKSKAKHLATAPFAEFHMAAQGVHAIVDFLRPGTKPQRHLVEGDVVEDSSAWQRRAGRGEARRGVWLGSEE